MAGIVIITTLLMVFLLSGRPRSTSLLLVASAVFSGVPVTTAISGHPSQTATAAREARISTWVAAPPQRATAAAGTMAILSVVYSASMGIH